MGSDLEEVVDIKSSIAYLLVKWKLIVLIALICAAAGGGFAMVKRAQQSKESTEISHEEKIEKIRGTLQESDALYVEQLCGQYKDYGRRLNDWRAYMSRSALQGMDPCNYVKRDIQYAVQSDNSSAVNALTVSLLDQSDYAKIAELMGYDPLTASVQELVEVTNTAQLSSTDLTGTNIEGSVIQEVINDSEGKASGILNITCIINNAEAADSVQAVIDAAVQRKTGELNKAGAGVVISKAGTTESLNDSAWLIGRQQAKQQTITVLQTNRSNLIKNSVDTLPEDQLAYFNILKQDEEDGGAKTSASKAKKVNLKKYVAAGGLGGLLLALAAVYLTFIFSDKIRSEEELRSNFKLPVLQKILVGKAAAGADVIRNKGLAVLGAPQGTEGNGADLLKAELGRRLAGQENSLLYIAYDRDSEEVTGSMKKLAGDLSDENMRVIAGNPVANEADCRELLKSDAVVVAETLNVSAKKTLKELSEICRRNGIQMLGCVTLFDAAKY